MNSPDEVSSLVYILMYLKSLGELTDRNFRKIVLKKILLREIVSSFSIL